MTQWTLETFEYPSPEALINHLIPIFKGSQKLLIIANRKTDEFYIASRAAAGDDFRPHDAAEAEIIADALNRKVDFKALLKKYMALVIDCEGVSFINGGPMHGKDHFTEEEMLELQAIEKAAST